MKVPPFVYMPSIELCERPAAAPEANLPPAGEATIAEPAVTEQLAAEAAAGAPGIAAPETPVIPAQGVPVQVVPVQVIPVQVSRAPRSWRPSMRRLIILASIVLGMRIFVGEASVVPTASMEGTILVGDHLFMDKLLYGPEIPLVHWRLPMIKTIHRGEIIVFRYPKDPSETFLKRVTAVGGDRLEIRDGVLYVNSSAVQEPYAVHHAPVHSQQESWGPTVVPEGELFVMGDNRDNSSDSRDWGFVPVGNVLGEPMFVYWSYDAPTSRWLDENPSHRISFYASIAGNFISHTRWSRTGMLL
jgi:signal peptidase I